MTAAYGVLTAALLIIARRVEVAESAQPGGMSS
jgi:hypothetical protein